MKIKKIIATLILAFTCAVSYAQYENELAYQEQSVTIQKTVQEPGDIVTVAAGNESFITLVTAVKAAGLVETLQGEGPFTVFAPTNEAFEKLPEGTVATLLKEENKEQLTSVLTYHVVAGKITARDLLKAINVSKGSFKMTTVQGQVLTASIYEGNVVLTDSNGNTATVTSTDVEASNGVIHVIDQVVLPKS